MENIRDEIIKTIKRNRISTTEVADCLGKTGVLKGADAINRGHFCVGPIKWIYAYQNSNWTVHEQARDIHEGDVVFIEAFDCEDRAIIGELVSKFMVLYQGAVAIISNARQRDGNDLIKDNYPIWCPGFSPVGCFNIKPEQPLDETIEKTHRELYDGAIAVCDDSGVVIIPKNQFHKEFLKKLEDIERQEDIWFDCLDRLKWDTYDIVCLKKYKNNK
ncbi:MAG: RraA family protein [Erysipelotrichaceae bacterium]|nr:RraA family protein [Erysipelotrichaceae bacterium]